MKKIRSFLIRAAFALLYGGVCAIVSYFGLFSHFELYCEDNLYQSGCALNNDIKIIAIDDRTLSELGDYSMWSRNVYVQLIDTLTVSGGKPAVIAFDIMFFEQKDEAGDTAFAEACKRAGNVVTASKLSTEIRYDTVGGTIDTFYINGCNEPYGALAANSRFGFVNVILDDDGYVRHSLGSVENYKSFPR